MARRVLALLLVGAWQLQQAVPPHWHPLMGAADIAAHAERRHFHWSHEHADDNHAEHDHSRPAPDAPSPTGEVAGPTHSHDEDAVYLDVESLADISSGSAHGAVGDFAAHAEQVSGVISAHEAHTSALPRYGGQPPTFLETTRLLL